MFKKKDKNDLSDIFNDDSLDSNQQFDLVREILENTQNNIKKALDLLKEKDVDPNTLLDSLRQVKAATTGANLKNESNGTERIIEGVFNGEKMVSGEGVEYNIPANYASKSKLVEGDIMKLTIKPDGSFVYKQIGPVERKQLIATLAQSDASSDWFGLKDNKKWKLLTASVTYFHGEAGDDVVILVPEDGSSKWAAVENVIKIKR